MDWLTLALCLLVLVSTVFMAALTFFLIWFCHRQDRPPASPAGSEPEGESNEGHIGHVLKIPGRRPPGPA